MQRAAIIAFIALAGVASAVAALDSGADAALARADRSDAASRRSLRARRAAGSKQLIGYFYNLYRYDPHGGAQPLPAGTKSAAELLEAEIGPLLSNYDVVIQSFIDPGSMVSSNGTIDDTVPQGPGQPSLADWRDGVNGKPGLKALCGKAGIPLMISIGGGGAAKFVSATPGPLVAGLHSFVVSRGYAGVDVDEENSATVDTYVGFIEALGKAFKPSLAAGGTANDDGDLLVSCTIGPLSCCFQSRGICKAAAWLDWAFLMMYDGLQLGAAWSLPAGSTSAWWQGSDGQEFCGIKPSGPQQHGIVSNVGQGACQFINFALYLNWPADKLVFGMPLYSHSPVVVWGQAMTDGYKAVSRDHDAVLTSYSPSAAAGAAGGAAGGVYLMSPSDVTERVQYVLNPSTSKLGVTLDNTGWQSKILSCGNFTSNSTHVGATIYGIGTWEMSHEYADHHEVSDAAAKALHALNAAAAATAGAAAAARVA